MSERGTQVDYWNGRAGEWDNYDVPLIPDQQDVAFMRAQLVPGGDTLILGATRELTTVAVETSSTVTAVDSAQNVIEKLRRDGVTYIHADWFAFFEQRAGASPETPEQFDTILTDGGLLCLDFPNEWSKIARHITTHLRPNGIFAARVYVSTDNPPQDTYKNPNLGRFITSMKLATPETNWMMHPTHPDYANYDMLYALPPEAAVVQALGQAGLHLVGTRVPDYEAGEHFPSYAWQKSQ